MALMTQDKRGPGMPGVSANNFGDTTSGRETDILSQSAAACWDLQDVVPEGFAYIGMEDSLVITCLITFSGNLTVSGRVLDARLGKVIPFQTTLAVTASTGIQQFQIPTQEGFLIGATIVGSNAGNGSRQNYASLGILRGPIAAASIMTELCAGYVNQMGLLSWPIMGITNPREGNGVPVNDQVGNPAAGADFAFTVPGAQRRQTISVHAVLTTAAAVANRQVQFILDDGANVLYSTIAAPAQAASLAWDYTAGDFGFVPTQVLTSVNVTFSPMLLCQQNFRIRSLTTNIQAADQWSAIRVLTRAWIDQG